MNRSNGFTETIEVTTHQQGFDSVYMRYPYRVRLTDSTLYVTDLHASEFFCHAFEYPSMKHIKSFAKRGKGPQEMIYVVTVVASNGIVYMLDAADSKIYTYDGEQVGLMVNLPREMIRCLDFTLYNDSTFIIPDYSGQHRVIFVNQKGEIIRRMGNISGKEQSGSISEVALGQAWRSFVHYNPNNNILALATQLGEVLEIYDLNNDQVKIVVGKGGEPKCRYRATNATPNGIMGYSDVVVGDRYIYALFWGAEIEKIGRGEITTEGGNFIHIFDLQGNPVRQYHLDRYITGFHVDEVSGEVIGTDVNEEKIVTFSLNLSS